MHLAPEGSGCAIASGPAFPRWSKRGREPGRNAFDTFAMNAINFDVNIEATDIIHIHSIKIKLNIHDGKRLMIWLKTTRAYKVAIQRNMQSKNIVIISFIEI